MSKRILAAIFTLFFLPLPAQSETLSFSILPRFFPEQLKQMMGPMAEYLEQETGHKVVPVITESFSDYAAQVMAGNIDLGFVNPPVYVKTSEVHEILGAAVKGAKGRSIQGLIITWPGSGVEKLDDLRGKSVIMVGLDSIGGFLSQKKALADAGISTDELKLDPAAGNKQENVAIGVSVGDYDAGFIRKDAIHIADKYIPPGSIKPVADGSPIATSWAFAAKRSLPEDVKASIRAALLKLQKDHPVAKAMKVSGFAPGQDSDYDLLRGLMGK